jgi:hypothetical protein
LKRIYIAGPMRGLPDYNFPAFREAAVRFRQSGWVVVSPVEVGMMFGNDPSVPGGDYVREDLLHLVRCDAIALLPGWEASTGARCEVVVAITIGLTFFDAEVGDCITPPSRVTCCGGYEQPAGVVPE